MSIKKHLNIKLYKIFVKGILKLLPMWFLFTLLSIPVVYSFTPRYPASPPVVYISSCENLSIELYRAKIVLNHGKADVKSSIKFKYEGDREKEFMFSFPFLFTHNLSLILHNKSYILQKKDFNYSFQPGEEIQINISYTDSTNYLLCAAGLWDCYWSGDYFEVYSFPIRCSLERPYPYRYKDCEIKTCEISIEFPKDFSLGLETIFWKESQKDYFKEIAKRYLQSKDDKYLFYSKTEGNCTFLKLSRPDWETRVSTMLGVFPFVIYLLIFCLIILLIVFFTFIMKNLLGKLFAKLKKRI